MKKYIVLALTAFCLGSTATYAQEHRDDPKRHVEHHPMHHNPPPRHVPPPHHHHAPHHAPAHQPKQGERHD